MKIVVETRARAVKVHHGDRYREYAKGRGSGIVEMYANRLSFDANSGTTPQFV